MMVAEVQDQNQEADETAAAGADVSKPIVVVSDNDDEDNADDTTMTPKNVEEIAIEYKEKGNSFYSKKEFEKALEAYQLGLQVLDKDSTSSSVISVTLRSNQAMVLLKLRKYVQAESVCTEILQIDPNNTKGKRC
jgi:tetratricopeptide (TPR) repeat protein